MHRLTTGSPFEARPAYSRAVVKSDLCFVSGVTGIDYANMTMPDDAGLIRPDMRVEIEVTAFRG